MRDTMAEMAARAHEISLEAGSKMAGALRDVVNAAAGLADFALESARDLVQYMVRRGQMTQDDADKLLRDAEEAAAKRPGAPPRTSTPAAPSITVSYAPVVPKPVAAPPAARVAPPAPPAPAAPAPAGKVAKPVARSAAPAAPAPPAVPPAVAKTAAKPVAKTAKPAAKAASKPAAKVAAKPAGKAAPKAAAKPAKPAAKASKPAAKKAATKRR
ncbi:MAG: hypothetical protein ACJ8AO_15085 [Gemmatimonadaceae bacterium]